MTLLSKPKTKRGRETLKRICCSAEKEFSAKGYHNTTINDITSGADIAPGTFYIYFKDKISVFKYLIEYLNRELRKEITGAIQGCDTRFEEEHEGFKAFFSFLSHHRGLFKIIWEAQFVDEKIFRQYYDNIAAAYTKQLTKAQKNEEVRSELDPQTLAYTFIGIANFIGLKWIIFDNQPVPDETIDDLMAFFKKGAFLS